MARTFDRLIQFDETSRQFPIRALVPQQPRSYTWRCTPRLNQGEDGACVGFSWAHELAARPFEVPVSFELACRLYLRAQQLDEYPGEQYEGSSVIAGAKAVIELGHITSYRWAFGAEDLALGVGHHGPAVLGLYWHADMMDTDRAGFIRPSGGIVGGHAILCRGVDVHARYFILRQSWGAAWGLNGDCKVSFDDMETLLQDQGEACIPLGRT